VRDWQQFENLVAAIHRVLNSSDYDVETDVVVEEPSSARHQIDVLLRPRTPFAGPGLVSCKVSSVLSATYHSESPILASGISAKLTMKSFD
jgi:hypothetical protein